MKVLYSYYIEIIILKYYYTFNGKCDNPELKRRATEIISERRLYKFHLHPLLVFYRVETVAYNLIIPWSSPFVYITSLIYRFLQSVLIGKSKQGIEKDTRKGRCTGQGHGRTG